VFDSPDTPIVILMGAAVCVTVAWFAATLVRWLQRRRLRKLDPWQWRAQVSNPADAQRGFDVLPPSARPRTRAQSRTAEHLREIPSRPSEFPERTMRPHA
jgi:hypothetical protein